MKKNKIILFIIYILFLPIIVNADAVDVLLSKYSNVFLLEAEFVQKTLIKGFDEEYYSGKVYLIKGKKLLWNYEKPYWQFYFFNKNIMEYYDSSLKQLMRQKINLEDNVVLQLIMDLSTLKKNFKIEFLEDRKFKLTPKEEIGILYIILQFDNIFVKRIKSEDNSGNITEIVFQNVEVNKKIDDKVFNLVVPLDTEIFDYTK
ncbi:outer membrane lipoprotein carrier protein LolA [Deferribacter thermophilus]|uniref:LolA family protein n=1 Tax=Deferribacter thermophilus TaxID=53573 RepID=UPI003C1ABF02